MTDPCSMPDRIPANDEPELAYDRPSPEVDEDREHEEYIQRQLEEEEEGLRPKGNSWPTK
jgi:hypothetical protein